MANPTKEDFLSQVENHKLTIVKDDGLHRHLILSSGSFNRRYEIVTFPGYLVYVGDMGDFVFRRLEDMFQFFRGTEINPDYWSDKLEAVDRRGGGYHEFSAKRFIEVIKDDFENYWDFETPQKRKVARKHLEEEMEWWNLESQDSSLSSAMDYKCPISKNEFTDLWEHDYTEYTYSFIWACYAIQWAIEKYDEEKSQ